MTDKQANTRTFELNKLVRDKVVEKTEAAGGSADYDVLTDSFLTEELLNKLQEEVEELRLAGVQSLDELADIREVVDALAVALGHRKVELDSVQYDKRKAMGGFAAGHYVTAVTLPEDNQWAKYYAADPARFPEIK